MKTFALISILLVSLLVLTIDVNCDEAADLKLENEKFVEAKKVLQDVLTRVKSDYIKNFASILAKGVVELEEKTQNELKVIKNATQREATILFATKAYERLIKFIKEIEEHFPTTN